jgi:hypothetical protein
VVTGVAADVGAGQAQVFTDELDQQRLCWHVARDGLAVHAERQGGAHASRLHRVVFGTS